MSEWKPSGIIRRIDDLGRIVIPREIRRKLRLRESDLMELYICDDSVVLKKYPPTKPVQASLELLREAVEDEDTLTQREALLAKIAEMRSLLMQEND
ncbi:AbrB/MazE/SpoVT family DNA-binding domain-containing protein [Intestinimonas butyriciproducens]|uniref:Stage V sporulation protein T, AbrB family transcriptional regulator (SpoVT) n=1 Tax=Intestinimonas butyriciproducens TaxID=1297617 RepID=A0A0S2W4R2_9FIRM|nr:Stage V sporulation protein T, AbrB family transcriptional regulator (SpoVT) [Intestinimonas butyriciproducens]